MKKRQTNNMASNEHLKLSAQIKSVHKKLRKTTKKFGSTDAWQEHIQNEDQLYAYCQTMKQLATEYWEQNQKNQENRIQWSVQYCLNYFRDTKIRQQNREREQRIYDQMDSTLNSAEFENSVTGDLISKNKIRLLDVGSCYNPFKRYDDFDVTAIDISPATPDVQNCDFLSVPVINYKERADSIQYSFNVKSYDVIIFSLLLKYMPTSEQRLTCCRKAYEILDAEGILIIITPDSKHPTSPNAKLMKNWRYTLALMGFTRIKYEKMMHITCMVFRKALFKDVAIRWATIHKEDYMTNDMFIPQDFNEFEDNSSDTND